MSKFRIVVERNDLAEIGPRTRKLLGQVVRKVSLDVEADAKTRAPVDTGALRASIQAASLGPLAAEIAVGVDYGEHVEFGTTRVPAQSYLGPAMAAIEEPFRQAVAVAVERGAGE